MVSIERREAATSTAREPQRRRTIRVGGMLRRASKREGKPLETGEEGKQVGTRVKGAYKGSTA